MMTKIFPSRTQAQPVKIIADFDALISEPIGFKFQGKSYVMKPIDTETFLKVSKGLEKVQGLIKQQSVGTVTQKEIYQGYLNFIEPVCPEFDLKSIQSMTLSQLNALVSLMIRHMTGNTMKDMMSSEVDASGEKKKMIL